MSQNPLKTIAEWSISRGLVLPHAQWERVSELWFLRDLLLQLKVDCVLDVGANRGQFARELRGIGYTGAIVSFEPIASEFDLLRASFSGDPKWRGYNIALGAAEDTMTITIPRLTVLSSLLDAQVVEPGARVEAVSVKRLDAVFAELTAGSGHANILLKMDTQGYDLEVFKGAAGCLAQICAIQSELSVRPLYKKMPHYLEALAAYEYAGFDLHNLSVVNRAEDHGLFELNCLMRRPPVRRS